MPNLCDTFFQSEISTITHTYNQHIYNIMFIKQAIPVATKALLSDSYMNLLFLGEPGVGKTEMVRAIAKECNRELMIKHPIVESPIDGKGLPVATVVDGKPMAAFIAYGDLKKMMEATEPLIVFVDDLGQAAQSVQAVYMQLIQERSINGKKISDYVKFVAATNDKTHNAGVSGLITPLLSRFACIINIEADAESWVEWAFKANMHPALISYITMKPDMISNFDPKQKGLKNFACPRTIENLNKWISLDVIDLDVWSGCVGDIFAKEFYTYFQMYKIIMRYLASIESDPVNADMATNGEAYFMITVLINNSVKKGEDYFTNVSKHVDRYSKEYQVFFYTQCARQSKAITETTAYINWSVANPDVIV